MNKKIGVIGKVFKCEIKGDLFYRILYFNKLGDRVATVIYQKFITGGEEVLKKVFAETVKRDYLNKLSLDNSYEELSEEEAKNVLDLLEGQEIEVFDLKENKEIEFFETRNICGTQYLLTKDFNFNFYYLNEVSFNEHKIAVSTKPIENYILPYVLMDLIEEFKLINKTFQVFDGTFVRVQERNDKYCILIYELIQSEENKQSLRVLHAYTIVKNEDTYELLIDLENATSSNLTTEDLQEVTQVFLNELGLVQV